MEQLKLLQDLQDTYAARCGLGLVITNTGGEFLTRPSGNADWLKRLAETGSEQRLAPEVAGIARLFKPLERPVEYEWQPGIKLFLAPVQAAGTGIFYLWAVFFAEIRAKRMLGQYYESGDAKTETLKPLQEEIPALNGEQKRHLGESLNALAETAALLLASREQYGSLRRQSAAFLDFVKLLDQPNGRVRDVLQLYFKSVEGVELLGYAAKVDETRFQVTDILTEAGIGLVSSTFSLGEGFLGQAATTRQFGMWEHISRDPRALFFTQNHVHPEVLFCFPVIREATVTGILFGANLLSAAVPEEAIGLGQAVALLLGAQMDYNALREDRNTHYLRLSMLMEICKSMTVVQDMKRVLFILIDMSLNLVQGPFTCVLLHPPSGKAQMVSRGLKQDQVEDYIKELSQRYPTGEKANPPGKSPLLQEFMGKCVLECPLFYRDDLFGVLSVGLKNRGEYDEYKEFMLSLAIVGSAAIHRIHESERSGGPNIAVVLHRALQQWNPEGGEQLNEAKHFAVGFAKHRMLKETDIGDIGDVCLTALYDSDLLEEQIPKPSFHTLVREVVEICDPHRETPADGAGVFSEAAQIAALALDHAGALPKSGKKGVRVEPQLKQDFEDYVNRSEVVDMEVSFGETAAAREDRVNPMEVIKELTSLSSREQEVLRLVAAGSSNRDIAEKLYISEHTVKNHMTNIFHKLNVTDRSQLIAMVYRMGYGQPQE